jgi:hypothetical protein
MISEFRIFIRTFFDGHDVNSLSKLSKFVISWTESAPNHASSFSGEERKKGGGGFLLSPPYFVLTIRGNPIKIKVQGCLVQRPMKLTWSK